MAIGKTNSYILSWIEQLQSRGKITFSFDEVITDFPEKSENAIIQSLSRLSQRGRVVSIYKSFYLIIPPEYYAREILPPILFIDYLMEFIAKPYYVGLLSAAALYGAAHQQPQEFFAITNTKQLATRKKGIKINYVIKKKIPVKFLDKRKTETGYVKVSSPELTAFDLVKLFSVATIQRLGYIFDSVLNEVHLANKLWKASQDLKMKFFRQPLNTFKKSSGYITDPRWKIIINTEIVLF